MRGRNGSSGRSFGRHWLAAGAASLALHALAAWALVGTSDLPGGGDGGPGGAGLSIGVAGAGPVGAAVQAEVGTANAASVEVPAQSAIPADPNVVTQALSADSILPERISPRRQDLATDQVAALSDGAMERSPDPVPTEAIEPERTASPMHAALTVRLPEHRPAPPAPRRTPAPAPTPGPAPTAPRAVDSGPPDPSTRTTEPGAGSPAPAPSAGAAMPGGGGGGGATSQPGSGPGLNAYLGELAAWLERHKRFPRVAQRRSIEGTAVLHFVVAADGQVLDSTILRSAGHALLDDAVIDMVRRASPLPPRPAGLGTGPMALSVPIAFRLQ